MSNRYNTQREKDRIKKKAKEKLNEKPKITITEEIICNHCRKFSGWTNDDLRYISGEKEIKCTKCGKPCIQTLCKKKNLSNNE